MRVRNIIVMVENMNVIVEKILKDSLEYDCAICDLCYWCVGNSRDLSNSLKIEEIIS